MKKVLVLASVASMIDQFNMPFIKLLKEMGYKVDVACNFKQGNTCTDEKVNQFQEKLSLMGVDYFQIDFARDIAHMRQNIRAYKQVKELLLEKDYVFIHCHSPIGGAFGRLTGHKTKTKVIYTAHGFHFYKGAPLKNWLLYYPVEKLLSRWTDVLITINKEDYMLAKNKMHAKKVYYVPGVGIDVVKFANKMVDKDKKRAELGVPTDAFLLLSVGELNKNKNHEVVIRALAQIKDEKIHYAIAGQGKLKKYLCKLATDLGIADRVHLLGYRTDIAELYKAADVCVFPSIREGFGLAAIEGMACGLPLIGSNNRGTGEYLENGKNGFVCEFNDSKSFANAISNLYKDFELRLKMGTLNENKAKSFDIELINQLMKNIYNKY